MQDALVEMHGVGAKVADCVALFSLDQLDAIPVDTHVWQACRHDCPNNYLLVPMHEFNMASLLDFFLLQIACRDYADIFQPENKTKTLTKKVLRWVFYFCITARMKPSDFALVAGLDVCGCGRLLSGAVWTFSRSARCRSGRHQCLDRHTYTPWCVLRLGAHRPLHGRPRLVSAVPAGKVEVVLFDAVLISRLDLTQCIPTGLAGRRHHPERRRRRNFSRAQAPVLQRTPGRMKTLQLPL